MSGFDKNNKKPQQQKLGFKQSKKKEEPKQE
jgi:hypothetical protein